MDDETLESLLGRARDTGRREGLRAGERRILKALRVLGPVLKAFDESKHPRDHGKFASGPGGGASATADPEPAREPDHEEAAWRLGRTRGGRALLAATKRDTYVHLFHALEKRAMYLAKKVQRTCVLAREERGLDAAQSDRFAKLLYAADFVGGYVTGAGAVAAKMPVGVVKAAMFMPSASVAYLAYSTAKNPAATWRAAKRVVAEMRAGQPAAPAADDWSQFQDDAHVVKAQAPFGGGGSGGGMPHALAMDLAAALRAAPDPDWFEACFIAALGHTRGDAAEALRVAKTARKPVGGDVVEKALRGPYVTKAVQHAPVRKGYDPDEARDESGKWTSGGGGGAAGEPRASLGAGEHTSQKLDVPDDQGDDAFDVRVWTNPSVSQIRSKLENLPGRLPLRGLVDGDDLHVWWAEDVHHTPMAEALGISRSIESEERLYISLDRDTGRLVVDANVLSPHVSAWAKRHGILYGDEDVQEKAMRLGWSRRPGAVEKALRGLVTKAVQHAPKGGISLAGKHFHGGQFIPAADLAKATPAEKKELKEKHAAGGVGAEGGEKPTHGKPYSQVLYHGTRRKIDGDSLVPAKPGAAATDAGNMGKGVYFTPHERVGRYHAGGDDEGLHTVPVSLKNPIVIEGDKNKQAQALAEKLGVQAAPEYDGTKQINHEWSEELARRAMAAGHDGVVWTKNGNVEEVASFHPVPLKGESLAPDRVTATHNAIKEHMASGHPDRHAKIAALLQGHTHKELDDLKQRLGLRATGAKAQKVNQIALRAAGMEQPEEGFTGRLRAADGHVQVWEGGRLVGIDRGAGDAPERVSVDDAHRRIRSMHADGSLQTAEGRKAVADMLQTQMTHAEITALKRRLGLDGPKTGLKAERAKKLAERAAAMASLPESAADRMDRELSQQDQAGYGGALDRHEIDDGFRTDAHAVEAADAAEEKLGRMQRWSQDKPGSVAAEDAARRAQGRADRTRDAGVVPKPGGSRERDGKVPVREVRGDGAATGGGVEPRDGAVRRPGGGVPGLPGGGVVGAGAPTGPSLLAEAREAGAAMHTNDLGKWVDSAWGARTDVRGAFRSKTEMSRAVFDEYKRAGRAALRDYAAPDGLAESPAAAAEWDAVDARADALPDRPAGTDAATAARAAESAAREAANYSGEGPLSLGGIRDAQSKERAEGAGVTPASSAPADVWTHDRIRGVYRRSHTREGGATHSELNAAARAIAAMPKKELAAFARDVLGIPKLPAQNARDYAVKWFLDNRGMAMRSDMGYESDRERAKREAEYDRRFNDEPLLGFREAAAGPPSPAAMAPDDRPKADNSGKKP